MTAILVFALNNNAIASNNQTENAISENSEIGISYEDFLNLDENKLQSHPTVNLDENETVDLEGKKENKLLSEETIDIGLTAYANDTDNTSANSPLDINAYETINGNLTEANENRWFRLQVNDSNRLAVLLQNASSLDSELYIYNLNSELMQLSLVAYSCLEGEGQLEYIDFALDEGTYYILVYDYSGSGDFTLNCYAPSKDYSSSNNTIENATDFGTTTSINISDSISIPTDVKYYKFNVSSKTAVKYTVTIPQNCDYLVAISPNNGNNFYNMGNGAILDPGTYTIMVGTKDMTKCSRDNFNIRVYNPLIPGIPLCLYTSDFTNFLQFDLQTEECYVNGHRVSCTYDYEYHIDLGSAGYNDIYMNLWRTDQTHFNLEEDRAAFVNYHPQWLYESTGKGDYSNVLSIGVHGVDCKIRSSTTGLAPFKLDSDYAKLIIDPNTGEIIDLYEPNYYYNRGSFRRSETPLTTNVDLVK